MVQIHLSWAAKQLSPTPAATQEITLGSCVTWMSEAVNLGDPEYGHCLGEGFWSPAAGEENHFVFQTEWEDEFMFS